ncbi:hypothetical protein [Paracoccus marcusii]
MTWNGQQPVIVNGQPRTFLQDGDEVGLFAHAQGRAIAWGSGPAPGA